MFFIFFVEGVEQQRISSWRRISLVSFKPASMPRTSIAFVSAGWEQRRSAWLVRVITWTRHIMLLRSATVFKTTWSIWTSTWLPRRTSFSASTMRRRPPMKHPHQQRCSVVSWSLICTVTGSCSRISLGASEISTVVATTGYFSQQVSRPEVWRGARMRWKQCHNARSIGL